MSPYFAFKHHPSVYRLSVKLYKICYRLITSISVPAMAWTRRHYCARVDSIPGLPLYVYDHEEDVQAMQTLFESSVRIMDEKSPIWGRRMRRLFRFVLFDAKAGLWYIPVHKCCCVNPWPYLRRCRNANHPAVPLRVASYIIHTACSAFLWEQHGAYLGNHDRAILSMKAEIRFLLRCLGLPKDAATFSRIIDAHTGPEFAALGITKDSISKHPGIPGVVGVIRSLHGQIRQVQEAKEKRLQKKGLGRHRQTHEVHEEHDKNAT